MTESVKVLWHTEEARDIWILRKVGIWQNKSGFHKSLFLPFSFLPFFLIPPFFAIGSHWAHAGLKLSCISMYPVEGEPQRAKLCSAVEVYERLSLYYTLASWAIALPEKRRLGSKKVNHCHHSGLYGPLVICERLQNRKCGIRKK